MDYLVGILLIATPWLFSFAREGAETWVPVVLGTGAVVYSLITDYELGLWKGISMRAYLALDMWSGIILAASPWLFNFHEFVYMPHLVLGIFEAAASLMSVRWPSASVASGHQHRRTLMSHRRANPSTFTDGPRTCLSMSRFNTVFRV